MKNLPHGTNPFEGRSYISAVSSHSVTAPLSVTISRQEYDRLNQQIADLLDKLEHTIAKTP
jgi:hypothetical protein